MSFYRRLLLTTIILLSVSVSNTSAIGVSTESAAVFAAPTPILSVLVQNKHWQHHLSSDERTLLVWPSDKGSEPSQLSIYTREGLFSYSLEYSPNPETSDFFLSVPHRSHDIDVSGLTPAGFRKHHAYLVKSEPTHKTKFMPAPTYQISKSTDFAYKPTAYVLTASPVPVDDKYTPETPLRLERINEAKQVPAVNEKVAQVDSLGSVVPLEAMVSSSWRIGYGRNKHFDKGRPTWELPERKQVNEVIEELLKHSR